MSVTNHQVTQLFYHLLDLPEVEKIQYLETLKQHKTKLYNELYPLIFTQEKEPITFLLGINAFKAIDIHNDLSNTYIDKYYLCHEIGRGGVGIVYDAIRVNKTFKQRLAIKFIRPTLSQLIDKEYLFKEAQVLADLHHPYIAKVMDGGVYQDSVYIVMEHVKGCTLNEYLSTYTLSRDKKLKLFLKICAAITHAHKYHILHADLKPENILIDSDALPKLLDFNLMQDDQKQTAASNVPYRSVKAYSHDYASPEQTEGKKLTVQSDIYSLGKILRFMFPKQQIESRDLNLIIHAATIRNCSLRYTSVSKLSDDIKLLISGHPISVHKNQPIYVALKFLQRHPIQCTLSAVLISGGIGLYTPIIKKNHQLSVEKRTSERVTYQFIRTLSQIREHRNSKASLNEVLKCTHKSVLKDPNIPIKTKKKLLRIIAPSAIKLNPCRSGSREL